MSRVASVLMRDSLPSFLANYENLHTRIGYKRGVQSFLNWYERRYGKALSWGDWTVYDTRDWVRELLDRGESGLPLKPASVRLRQTALRLFAQWGLEQRLLSSNPAKVKGVKLERRGAEPLTRTQQHALVRALARPDANPFHRALLLTLLHTGLRAQELVSLRLSDVILGESKKTLRDGIPAGQIRSGSLRVVGKGRKERTIPLNATARATLIEYMAIRPQVESERLFISSKYRTPITTKTLNYVCATDKLRAVAIFHPHTLRSTFANRLQEQGVPAEIVQQLLGHESFETTQRYYLESVPRQEYVEWITEED